MDIRLIGVVKDNLNKTIGFRLLDIESKSMKDVSTLNLMNVLKNHTVVVKGIELRGNELVGTNGSLDRYPVIIGGNITGKSPLIVIGQYVEDDTVLGYMVADWKGDIKSASRENVVQYARVHGIANGAIKQRGDTYYISSISGEYQRIYRKEKAKKEEVKTEEKREEIKVDDLDSEVWTEEQFKEYMESNNYDYGISIEKEIIFKCPEAKVIKYYDGVKTIEYDFSDTDINAEKIIISPSIEYIKKRIFEYAHNVEDLVLQEGMKVLEASGINVMATTLTSLSNIKFPKSITKITSGFSGFNGIRKLDLSHTSLGFIGNCFNNLINLDEVILPNTLNTIGGSFMNAVSLNKIVFPASLKRIGHSLLRESGITELDLEMCKELEEINSSSFTGCKKLTKVILPENLKTIQFNAFLDCTKLEYVEFPKGLEDIGMGAFKRTKIDRFVVYKDLVSIGEGAFTPDTHIVFDDSCVEVKNVFIMGKGFKKISLSDNIEEIGRSAFSINTNLQSINMPSKLKRIKLGAFRGCSSLTDVDLVNCKDLEEIGKYAFDSSGLRRLILPEGIDEISEWSFANCTKLAYVVIPKSITKIGKRAFYDVGISTSLGTTFYVYDKSFGLRYCKKNKLKYFIIDSLEQVYDIEESDRELDSNKEAKMKMLLSANKIHSELLDERFSNYADVLYRLYNRITREYNPSEHKLELNRSKFIDYKIEDIKHLDNCLDEGKKVLSTLENEFVGGFNKSNLSPRFIGLTNYITSVLDVNTEVLCNESMEYIVNNDSKKVYVNYVDNSSSITTVKISNGVSEKFGSLVVFITIGDRLVFASAIDFSIQSIIGNLLTESYVYENNINNSVAELLTEGDRLLLSVYASYKNHSISRSYIPKYIHTEVVKSIREHCIVIGAEKSTVKSGNGVANVIVDYLCLDTGKIITASSELKGDTVYELSDIRNILITGVIDNNAISDDIIKRGKNEIKNIRTKKFFEYTSNGEEYTNRLKSLQGAYDVEPCYEWKLAQLLCNLKSVKIVDLEVSIIQLILDSCFFVKTRKSLSSVSKACRKRDEYTLEDGRYKLVQYAVVSATRSKKIPYGEVEYFYGVVDTLGDPNKVQDFYGSSLYITEVIKIILKMKQSGNITNKIVDTTIEQDALDKEFVVIQRHRDFVDIDDISYNAMIVVSKSNGSVFLLGRKYETNGGLYVLLRFKSVPLALKHCAWMYTSISGKPSNTQVEMAIFKDRVYELLANIADGVGIVTSNYVKNLRDAVMNGVPNGHYVECSNVELVDDVAKQK